MIGHATAVPLGRGATSQVYRVFDESRGGWLAIKYLHHGDPVWRARLLREARALRQIAHPHICPILDVGEHDGRPWLAMPLIVGKTLDVAALELPQEARVRVLKQVADAVHHAHENGLLHRDLKPANIMVELDNGLPHAWVLDFGLIRELGTSSGTQTGEIVGTPAYMSPEQARGSADLDRRSDVYSLGAILYFLLTGRPPFESTSSADVLARTMNEQPTRPRHLQSTIPAALEAIALQCLEKSRDRRYASARALADDLDRYLQGQTVLARRGPVTALRRFAGRRPIMTTIAVTTTIAAFAIVGALLMQSTYNREQVRTAADLAARSESARQQLALTFARPEHDVRSSLADARSTVDQLLTSARNSPLPTQARALTAAGALQLTMGDLEQARAHLLAADAMAPSPDVKRLLGLAYARTYRALMAEPQLLNEPDLRQTRIDDARTRLLVPAREYLAGFDNQDWLVHAELAFTEGREDDALAALARGLENDPARYEARLMTAEILLAKGQQLHWHGDREAGVQALRQADEALLEALAFGRSDPVLHRRRCEVAGFRYEAMAEGSHPRELLHDDIDVGMDACQRALRVQPESAATHTALAQLLGNRAKLERITGTDALPTLHQAQRTAQTAVELAAGCPGCARGVDAARAAKMLALVQMRLSTTVRWAGNSDASLTESAEAVLAPWLNTSSDDPEALFIAALIAGEKGQVKASTGGDPAADLRRSIDLLRRAVTLAPQASFLRHNLASMLSSLQYHVTNIGRPDPTISREAIAELDAVLRVQPKRASAWGSLADSQWDLALALAYRGEPFEEPVTHAHAHYAKALDLTPDNLGVMFNWYSFSLFAANERMRTGRSAQSDLDRAAGLMARMDGIRPDWITPCPRAEFHLRNAGWLIKQHPDRSRAELARAERFLDEALAQQPDDVDCARRKIEAAAITVRFAATTYADLNHALDSALSFRDRHSAVPQVQLAWIELLATAWPRMTHEKKSLLSDDMARELVRLRELTGDAWQARLEPVALLGS